MNIRPYQDTDHNAWDDYVDTHPKGTFYHKIGWKTIIENTFNHKTYYLICESSGRIAGLLPLVDLKSILFGNILCSMPFLNFGGILADNAEGKMALLEEAEAIAKDIGADYIEFRNLEEINATLPKLTHKVSMTLQLDQDASVLWNNFSSKHRNELRKGLKNDLDFRVGKAELLGDFYKVLSEGWRDLGTPIYALDFFKNIITELNEFVEIIVVFYNNKPIATAFNGLYKNTVEGMWTYTLPHFRHLRTNYFLYWKMIERACQNGYEIFHLGRSSKDSGSAFFKSKWNAFEKQLYWEYILNRKKEMPNLNVENPKYHLLIKTWQKLPVKMTQLIGPHIAKYIP